MDGIINVHKEKGYTSHDVVAKLRGILHQKKIGHTGTLDPEATGVLPVCLGRATKVCELLTDKSKTYVAVVRLGVVTDTQDMTGNILEERPVNTTLSQIRKVTEGFVGEIWQTPPMYSAIKVNGKRLYELARQGIEVERTKRKITVYSCEVTGFCPERKEFTMEVRCSKGTYIRTLCHDIGKELSCGAAMASLVRTRVDDFGLEKAHTLSEIEEFYREDRMGEILFPVDFIFQAYPQVTVLEKGIKLLQNGNQIPKNLCRSTGQLQKDSLVRMYDEKGRFYAVYTYNAVGQNFLNHKMFFSDGFAGQG